MKTCRIIMAIGLLGLLTACLPLALRFPTAAVLIVVAIFIRVGKKHGGYTAHGTARWANSSDMDAAGMFKSGGGLLLGRANVSKPAFFHSARSLSDLRKPSFETCLAFMNSMRVFDKKPNPKAVRLNNAVHTAVFAPTGVGKGVSLVIPHLLTCPDSCVVVDFKGENAKLTAKHRAEKFGHKIVTLDPFKVVTPTPDTYNPLNSIDKDSLTALDECRALAEMLVIRTGEEKEPHWNDSAELWIAAMISLMTAHMTNPKFRSLQGVRAVLGDPVQMQQGITNMRESPAWGGMLERIGHQLGHYKDKELGSVLTTANRHLRFLDTQAIEASTISSSFNPAELRNGKMTVYLILPPEHMRAQSSLLRMWVGSMLRAVVKQGLGESQKVHFILDEAASLGRMEVLDDAVDKYRGYGVRCQFYYQSLGQLKQCWADGKDQTLLSNTTQVFFGVNDPQTADYVSNRLGESTIIVESGGNNHGGSDQYNHSGEPGNTGRSWGGADNWGQQARKLLKPEEVATLNPRIAITFAAGLPPISTMMVRYYEGLPDDSVSNWKRLLQHIELWFTALGLCVLAVIVWWLVLSL